MSDEFNENIEKQAEAVQSEVTAAETIAEEAIETRFLIEQEEAAARAAAEAEATVETAAETAVEAAEEAAPVVEETPVVEAAPVEQVEPATVEEPVAEDAPVVEKAPEAEVQKTAPMQAATKVKPKKTTIGGQALIEGIMMCGPRRTSIAVRKADGSIYVEEIKKSTSETFFEKVPFVRGCIRFFRQLVTGTAAMMKSAEISEQGAPEEKKEDKDEIKTVSEVAEASAALAEGTVEKIESSENADAVSVISETAEKVTASAEEKKKNEKSESKLDKWVNKHNDAVMFFAAILGLAFSIMLFILLPRLIVDAILGMFAAERSDSVSLNVALNFVEGFLRIVIFLTYLIFTSRIKDVARVWMYHGAEHKTIACYEAGEMLTVENVRKFSRFHPRCGTAFLFIVVLISILVFCVASVFIGVNVWWINLLIRLALVPLIGGISFEILRFTGRHDKNPVCKVFIAPGLWLQRFTTREPNDSMIEVAIAAMSAVIPENSKEDIW